MERGGRRWKNLKERLGFTGCCGSAWRFSGEIPADQETVPAGGGNSAEGGQNRLPEEECPGQLPTGSGMNLAAALAAERQFRATTQEWEGVVGGDSPVRVSLMKLLGGEEEREREGGEEEEEREKGGMCCVCMGRRKGAAFIPCGHTFCRVCSREVWMNRGACPLCNRPILEILDIF